MTTDTDRDIPGTFGTAPRIHVTADAIASGFYDLCPASLRPDGSKPRHLFDVATEEGRAARDAYLADVAETKAFKDIAYARHLAAQGASEGMFGDGI